ncbi:MAG: flagellar hook capping FlgD N-terminal domain-containing protein [bacterium]
MAEFQSITGLVGRLPTTFDTEPAQGEIDKNGFLKLLLTQMQNQDPLSPMDSTDYAANLAQFSSLEQLQNLNTSLDQGLQADVLLAQSINNTMAANLIGKDVKAYGDSVHLANGNANTVAFDLTSFTDKVEFTVKDASGNVIRTDTLTNLTEGEHTYVWDGKDDRGNNVMDGTYTVKANIVNDDGTESALETFIVGLVDAVRYESTGAILVVDGLNIGFGDVLELREPSSTEDSSASTTSSYKNVFNSIMSTLGLNL